jgi:hypothetical protein
MNHAGLSPEKCLEVTFEMNCALACARYTCETQRAKSTPPASIDKRSCWAPIPKTFAPQGVQNLGQKQPASGSPLKKFLKIHIINLKSAPPHR